jgi:dTDP-4-dehydrorhamnose 3,5-epimerase
VTALSGNIDGVAVTRPKVYQDERGSVMRMLRTDDGNFAGFGEVYFSTVNLGAIKGWRRHREMTMTLACPMGRVLLVVYDDREGSPTFGMVQSLELTSADYRVVTVPPMLWTGFMGVDERSSVITNCASILHRPGEADNLPLGDPAIPFVWPEAIG